MHSDEYGRLHAACVAMAEQSDLPDAKVRWLALAQALLASQKTFPMVCDLGNVRSIA